MSQCPGISGACSDAFLKFPNSLSVKIDWLVDILLGQASVTEIRNYL